MTIHTPFTDLFSLQHPIALAPMGDVAGGRLAAAVSNGGGLGIVGGGRGDEDWVGHELAIVSKSTEKQWGVGFLSWAVNTSTIERALTHRPDAILLSFGDPRPLASTIREGGARLVIQVTTLDEAKQAIDVGADVIVAQGGEAGGHGGLRATLPFVPAVVDLAGTIPVLAAGGIADGRGVAAAIVLGAAGALIGTRFEATPEALITPESIELLLARGGEDTERSRVLDIARDSPWPARYSARTLTNSFLLAWRHRVKELEEDATARDAYQQSVTQGDVAAAPIWAGEALDLIDGVVPAGELVRTISIEADECIAKAYAAKSETAVDHERT